MFPVLTVFLFFSVIYTISVGSTGIPFRDVYDILTDQLFHGGAGYESGAYESTYYQIIWNIRFPRVLFGIFCGAGLSVCGVVMQAIVLNPIADPFILGVSSGASAGAAFALLMPLPVFAGQYQTTATALIGALISSFAVYNFARYGGGGKIQPVTLLLSGTAINAVMSAVTNLLIFLAKSNESIAAVYNWQMGSLAAAEWRTLLLPSLGVSFGLVIFLFQSSKLDLIMMGDEDAASLGMNVRSFRRGMFIICSVMVASLVSITGIIGFVGLMVPHIIRLLSGSSNNRIVLPLSALFGGTYLIWADAAARGMFGAAELPIGIITAFVGAPFFFYLMIYKNFKRNSNDN